MGRRSSNLVSYISYDNRAQLRTTGGATGALRQIEDLGVFMFISGLTEPDDDETCFATPSGAWILQSPSMDVIEAFLRPELEEMREDITTLQGGGSTASTFTAGAVYGQAFYGFGEGQYTWTCPPGVTSVSVVCIGGGAGSQSGTYTTAPGGGGLGWKNNIAVVPGTTYTVQVGHGGEYYNSGFPSGGTSATGGDSWFLSSGTVRGGGGQVGAGGTYTGDGGGNGGYSGSGPGGGAGGYTGAGGGAGSAGSGGGAGGGNPYSSTYGYSSGGGTGPFGQGASGVSYNYAGGGGGSGGENGRMGENPSFSYGSGQLDGGLYGGGAGQGGNSSAAGGYQTYKGGRGCVRIIWGPGRSFPSTGTGDM